MGLVALSYSLVVGRMRDRSQGMERLQIPASIVGALPGNGLVSASCGLAILYSGALARTSLAVGRRDGLYARRVFLSG